MCSITLEPVVDGDMQQLFEKVNLTQIARIVTFEGQYVDLTNGLKDTYVPITAHRKALHKDKLNQELEETGDEGYIMIVNNGAQQDMSYPSANVRPENVLRQQAMAHPTSDTVWQRVVCCAGYKFIINDPLHGKLALTAWPVRAANKDELPLTLEREIEGDKQQVFNIETVLA